MKITIILGAFDNIPPYTTGAVQKLWFDLGVDFAQKGHEVNFICKNHKFNKQVYKLESQNIKIIYTTGYKRTNRLKIDTIKDFCFSLKALFKMPMSDILILNSTTSPLLSILFRWKFKFSLYNVARFPKPFYYYLFKNVDCLSCVSTPVAEKLEAIIKHHKNIIVIGNPINTNIFTYKKNDDINTHEFNIVYSGRIHPEKGLHILINALKDINKKNIKLTIIGSYKEEDGGGGLKYKKTLEEISDNLNINWISPIYDPNELANLLKKAHVYCYPSLAENGETFGVAPLEAMGCGKIVIVSNLDCFKDFICDKKNGYIFNHRENPISNLNNIIGYVMDNYKDLEYIRRNAYVTTQNYSIDNISDKYLKIFTTSNGNTKQKK